MSVCSACLSLVTMITAQMFVLSVLMDATSAILAVTVRFARQVTSSLVIISAQQAVLDEPSAKHRPLPVSHALMTVFPAITTENVLPAAYLLTIGCSRIPVHSTACQ